MAFDAICAKVVQQGAPVRSGGPGCGQPRVGLEQTTEGFDIPGGHGVDRLLELVGEIGVVEGHGWCRRTVRGQQRQDGIAAWRGAAVGRVEGGLARVIHGLRIGAIGQ